MAASYQLCGNIKQIKTAAKLNYNPVIIEACKHKVLLGDVTYLSEAVSSCEQLAKTGRFDWTNQHGFVCLQGKIEKCG